MEKKIIPFEKITEYVSKMRESGRKKNLVLCHGCFDIVHPGHIRHLKFAKEQGSLLIVSITPDVCIQKGSGRPYVPQDLRAENLAALEFVNAVTIAPSDTGFEVIKAVNPDIYVKGHEYALSRDPRFIKEKKLLESLGGKVVFSSGDVVFSSSEFIRSHDLNTAESVKLAYICKRYDIRRAVLSEILHSAQHRKFLIIGEILIDEYKYCEGLGIAQETPVLSISLKHKTSYVGGAGALALHLATLGADVTLLTSVDLSCEKFAFFSECLNNFNVSLSIIEDKQRKAVVKSHYFVEKNQVLEFEEGPYRPIDSSLSGKMIRQFKKEIKNAPDAVILSDYGYGLLSPDLVSEMVEAASGKNISMVSDISMTLRTQLDKFKDSDIFTVSEMELRSCVHDYENGLSVLVNNFYSQTNVKELYLSLADGSALYFKRPHNKKGEYNNMESAHIPTLSLRNEDKMGRGEAFTAGITLARVSGANEVQSIYLGSIFASVHSYKSGNASLNKDEIFHLIGERTELILAQKEIEK
ncbi:MAG: hypothetical protein A2020_01790 [Lentisphaerae bacterium GWF2_45_14]|nr:MAG: hypothetical protein A2020_01790 [Lentisphaerae bacterium GWF2_45_14]